MIIYYRMCSLKSIGSNPTPLYQNEPLKLHEYCLKSFVEAFKDCDIKVVFLCAFCNSEYNDLIERIVPFEYEIIHTALDINASCLNQYDLFLKSGEDKVLFQEYDYVWMPNTGQEVINATNHFDFVTPYDHLDKYTTELEPYVRVVGDRHWKQTVSTTATFATTKTNFERFNDLFYKWGYLDHARWIEIGENGGKLFSPIPSIATHMAKDFISPHVAWPFLL